MKEVKIGSPDDPRTLGPGAPEPKNGGRSALRILRNPNAATVGVLIACFTLTWMMLDGFRKDLKGDIAAVEVRLERKIAAVEVNIAAVEARLSADIGETEARLDGRLTRVENRLDRIMEILPGSRGAGDPEEGPS